MNKIDSNVNCTVHKLIKIVLNFNGYLISRARKKVFTTIVWKVVNFNMLILLTRELYAIKIFDFSYNYFQKL